MRITKSVLNVETHSISFGDDISTRRNFFPVQNRLSKTQHSNSCRVCGHIFCAKCCPKASQRDPPLAEGSDVERCCDNCYDNTKRRNVQDTPSPYNLVESGRNTSIVTTQPMLTAYKSYAKEVFAAQQKKLEIRLNNRIENLAMKKDMASKEDITRSKLLLAAIAQCNEQYEDAIKLLKDHLDCVEEWFGKSDPRVATVLVRIATVSELVVSSNVDISSKDKRLALIKTRQRALILLERALNIIRKTKDVSSDLTEEDITSQMKMTEFKLKRGGG